MALSHPAHPFTLHASKRQWSTWAAIVPRCPSVDDLVDRPDLRPAPFRECRASHPDWFV